MNPTPNNVYIHFIKWASVWRRFAQWERGQPKSLEACVILTFLASCAAVDNPRDPAVGGSGMPLLSISTPRNARRVDMNQN